MARQVVDIGLEGNDNTGDSIRESFRKVNENFNELYAVFGLGGQISITDLKDVPQYDTGNKLLGVNFTANGINFLELGSDSKLPNGGIDSIGFQFIEIDGKPHLIVRQLTSKISNDSEPSLSGPLNANKYAIANVGITQDAVNQYNDKYNPPITIDDVVITKGFADKNYLAKSGPGGNTRIRNEPESPNEYTISTDIINQTSRTFTIIDHGLGNNYTGSRFVFRTTGDTPFNLIDGETYFIKVVDKDSIALHLSQASAEADINNASSILTRIAISGGTGTFSLTDADYDNSLFGNWLTNEALPRKSIVRRQGDKMEGPLYLYDHPGELAGTDYSSIDSLQAATKLYVDNVSSASQINLFVKTDGDDLQASSPFGKEGRSYAYAFKTIGAAAKKAEEIIFSSPVEPGPYMQTITHSNKTVDSTVHTISYNSSEPDRVNARNIIIQNKTFIKKEAVLFVKNTYPTFEFDEETCERDIDLILEAITLDIISGNDANFLSRIAATRYFSSPTAKRSVTSYRTQTLAVHEFIKNLIISNILPSVLLETPYQDKFLQKIDENLDIDPDAANSISNKFLIIKGIIENGIFFGGVIDGQNTYKIYITNNLGAVDQGNLTNTDLIPGKLVRGKSSGAIGRIISYTREFDEAIIAGTDQIELQLVEPIEFIVGEEIEFGSVTQNTQITINVESGIYYEDFPIKVSPNVSINGDEFRRVIIRPKNRISQSPYVNTYFYRDYVFDDMNLFLDKESSPLSKGTEYINPITNEVDGYFGYHYLKDSRYKSNTGNIYENSGNWNTANRSVMLNKDFIVEQTLKYFETTYGSITINVLEFKNYLNKIILAIAKDLLIGGNKNTLEVQGNYWQYAIDQNIVEEVKDSIQYLSGLIKTICSSQTPSIFYGSNLEYPQTEWPDLSAGSSEPDLWSAGTQYLRNSVVRIPVGANFDYYKSRVVHVSTNNFSSDQIIYWIKISGVNETVDNLISSILFAYNPAYNPPRHNKDMDVFLMNDSTIIRNVTVQGQGGFMCVLDPHGQILNKSPYIQTGSSFSQSLNKKAFRGGLYVDGFTGNLSMKVVGKVLGNPFRLRAESEGSLENPNGLFIRRPETPCSFYIEGKRFQVNAVLNYDQTAGTAELLLDSNSNDGNGFTGTVEHYGTSYDLTALNNPVPITLQTAGNRSILGNDFTQINDMGYGLVCVNGALSEMVSMFTYYCYAGYYSKNGSEIRSLTGSTCYGQYGLVSEGSDPNEIPDDIALVNDTTQPARIFEAENILYFETPVSASAGDTISQTRVLNGIPVVVTAQVVIDVVNCTVLYVKNVTGGAFDVINTIDNIDTLTTLGTAYEIDSGNYTNKTTSLAAYVFDMKDVPLSGSEFDVYHPFRNIVGRYQVRNIIKTPVIVGNYKEVNSRIPTTPGLGGISGTGAEFSIQKVKDNGGIYKVRIDLPGTGYAEGNEFVISGSYLGGVDSVNDATIEVVSVDVVGSITEASISGTIAVDENTPYYDGQVYRLNFSRSDTEFSTIGIVEEINWYTNNIPTTIEYRRNESHIINGIENVSTLTIRPSTALIFNENEDFVYRTIDFTQQDSLGNQLDSDVVQVSFDSPYDFIKLNIDQENKNLTDPLDISKTLGGTLGDVNLAIRPLTEPSAIARLSNNLKMIFSWKGAKYQVYNYREVIPVGETEPVYAMVSITKVDDILNTGTGLSALFDLPLEQITVRAGIASTATGNVTLNISTCRATSHDFLDVGSGSYNDTNYPNSIFGKSSNNIESGGFTEVNEIGKGRVFYVSTDQNGVFKVGRFFTVDQGTGTVSFAASIALNDIDGIGFKRGVTVSEFSTDSAMSDNDENTVPVESAVRGHLNRRLGFNIEGNLVGNAIGPGAMSLGGPGLPQTAMKANMNLGNNKITFVATPTDNSDAANKSYVDIKVSNINGLEKLEGVSIETPSSGSVLAFTGNTIGTKSVNASIQGDMSVTLSGNTLNASISNGAITDLKVSNTAAISQSKLSLLDATSNTQAQAVKGISSFDSTFFDSTNGWISLKNNGVSFNKLNTVASGTLLGRNTTGTGNLSAITFESVFNAVGGVVDSDFNTTLGFSATQGDALVKTGNGTYAVTKITRTGEANSIVKTDNDGKIQVRSVILGGDSSFEILALSSSTTVLKTPSQGVILNSTGGNPTTAPLVTLPGSVVIGSGNADKSILQANAAAAINDSSRIKVDWIHTSFIEAAGEKDASSTGIAIGANTGRSNEGEIAIVTANLSNNTSVVPFRFSSSGVVPDLNNIYDIGSETRQYRNVWAETFNGTATSAYYADLAENYLADAKYEAGTVLVFGGKEEVTISNEKGTHRVAGVVSTDPAYLMNSMLEGEYVVALALQGRVPCKVVGPVKKGDLLVNSGVPGYACVDNNAKAGTIVGKSLEDKPDNNKGIVEIVVGKH